MKKILMTVLATLLAAVTVSAQSLAGRTYYNANIMADEFNKLMKDIDQRMGEARTKAYAKFEKEKGRKPTDAEKAKLEQKLQEARAKAEAVKKGTTTKVTIEFKTDKDLVMKADMKVSDEAMKQAGISWLKRKAMKAALAVAPSTTKGTYVVKGDLIIMESDGDKDTLRLSSDGNFLYGKLDKTNFKLTRTK